MWNCNHPLTVPPASGMTSAAAPDPSPSTLKAPNNPRLVKLVAAGLPEVWPQSQSSFLKLAKPVSPSALCSPPPTVTRGPRTGLVSLSEVCGHPDPSGSQRCEAAPAGPARAETGVSSQPRVPACLPGYGRGRAETQMRQQEGPTSLTPHCPKLSGKVPNPACGLLKPPQDTFKDELGKARGYRENVPQGGKLSRGEGMMLRRGRGASRNHGVGNHCKHLPPPRWEARAPLVPDRNDRFSRPCTCPTEPQSRERSPNRKHRVWRKKRS